jgi:hypothetical protein
MQAIKPRISQHLKVLSKPVWLMSAEKAAPSLQSEYGFTQSAY